MGRICVTGEPVHKEPKPDALHVDETWGYSWCEWPAMMDWNEPEPRECYEPSCASGFAPQWAQDAEGHEYTQVCLDQEPEKELGCPPGMSTMSVWEESDVKNQWGWNEWHEVKYCVQTRPMESLKTPRAELDKVFHYFDWIVKEDESINDEYETMDYDTTEGTAVPETQDVFYEADGTEKLPEEFEGDDFVEETNAHNLVDDATIMAETGFDDPVMGMDENKDEWKEDDGMVAPDATAADMMEGSGSGDYYYTAATDNWDSGSGDYYYTAATENWDSGMDTAANWDSGMDTAATDNSGMDTAATVNYEGSGSGSGHFKRRHKHRHH
jgi:hypothetical protein